MSTYISDGIIEKISEHADIVEVISEYIPLKKAGKNYKALCPFHEERTPSFVVSPEKQLFHCFGCGAGGNVFSFIMKWEKVSFPEAVKMLGEKVGISVDTSSGEENGGISRREFYQINETALYFFKKCLKENKRARDYLKIRGIEEGVQSFFKIGYAPLSGDFIEFCKEEKFPFENLEKIGLLLPSQKGKGYYAYFRERIIFPIFTPEGKVCGFGGRVLDDHHLPKYLNSPQSSVFDKGRNLYGLNFAKEFIKKEESVILVEGYTDLIFLYQAGIRNVVASLGTSLTPPQVRLIKRWANKVFITYDQDKAGISATLRGIDLLLEADLEIKIVDLPEGMDPAEVIKRKGKDFFIEKLREAKEYFDWRMNLEVSRRPSLSIKDKIEIVNSLFDTLIKVKSLIKIKELISEMARWLNLNESLLETEFEKFKGKEKVTIPLEFLKKEEAHTETEKMLLQLMLNDKEILKMVKEKWNIENFVNSSYRKIAQEAIFLAEKKELSISKLINCLKDEKLSSVVSSLYLEDIPLENNVREQAVLDYIKFLQKKKDGMEKEEALRKAVESEKCGDEESAKKWWRKYASLVRENKIC